MNRDIYAYNSIVRRNLLLVFSQLNKLAAAVICIKYNLVAAYCKLAAGSKLQARSLGCFALFSEHVYIQPPLLHLMPLP